MKTRESMQELIQTIMRSEQQRKARNYRTLNRSAHEGGILFTGSSLMELFPVCELASDAGITESIFNRGISGTTSDDFLREIDAVLLGLKPNKVFLNIGTNDMTESRYGPGWMDHLMSNYETILRTVRDALPGTIVYIMAFYPANLHMPNRTPMQEEMLRLRTKENLNECNCRLEKLAEQFGQRFINVNDGLTDENGELKAEYTYDGVHMYAEAYKLVFRNLKPYLV